MGITPRGIVCSSVFKCRPHRPRGPLRSLRHATLHRENPFAPGAIRELMAPGLEQVVIENNAKILQSVFF